MKNIILIFKNSVLRNKLMIILALASAVFGCFTFYGLSRDLPGVVSSTYENMTVGLCDYDGGISENIKDYFENTLKVDVVEKDYDSLSKDLIDKKISAIIEVPYGFYDGAANGNLQKPELTTLGDYENAAFIEAYLNSYLRGISVISQSAGGDKELFSEMLNSQKLPNEVKISETDAGVDIRLKNGNAYRSAVGFLMMIISAVTIIVSRQIQSDRQLETLDRMRCSSLKSSEYVIGVSVFGIICVTVVNLIFNAFAYLAVGNLTVPFGIAFAATELFVVFSVGISVMFGLLIDTSITLMTVGIGYTCFGSMLGGAWFPVSDNPGAVGNFSKLFPQYWLTDIFRNYSDAGFNTVLNLCIIALAAVLMYLVSAVIFSRKKA